MTVSGHQEEHDIPPLITRTGLLAVVGFAGVCLGFHCFGTDGWIPILDSANLALHEAGHPIVGIFSAQLMVYGGTLFQLVFPITAARQFRRAGNETGRAAALVWLGENCFNIARYMADARVQELPLVGNGDHDWAEIFGRWGVLQLDGRIAGMTRGIGFALIVGATVLLYRRWRSQEIPAATPRRRL